MTNLIKILVVDNEEDQLRLTSQILAKFGYSVKTASTGESALKHLLSTPAQLVLTDLIMQEMDGTELCERIKKIKPDVKVYAITGHADLYDDQKLVRSGFDGIIEKPIRINTLKETVEFAIGKVESASPIPPTKGHPSSDPR